MYFSRLLTRYSIGSFISFCDHDKSKNEISTSHNRPHFKFHSMNHNNNFKIIHFVRHAEGTHNLAAQLESVTAYLREDLEDAELTEKGKKQCQELHLDSSKKYQNIQLVVVSPMNRTMQTALLSFPQYINIVPWIAKEEIREKTGIHPCDKRKSISEHQIRYPKIDFSEIESNDDIIYPKYNSREPVQDVIDRATVFLNWLMRRPEREILVVTHSAFLEVLFEQVLHADEMSHNQRFYNCELRTIILTNLTK